MIDHQSKGTTCAALCPSCGNRHAYYMQIQIRSADEPMTLFYKVSLELGIVDLDDMISCSALNVAIGGMISSFRIPVQASIAHRAVHPFRCAHSKGF